MDEYTTFREESTEGWKLFMFVIWSILLIYTSYNYGYSEARNVYSTPIKYRCHQGVVYRNESGYWADTKQPCKSLEEIK